MDFYKRFEINIDSEEAKNRLVNRLQNNIISQVPGLLNDAQQTKLASELADFFGKRYVAYSGISFYISGNLYDVLAAVEVIYGFCKSNTQDELLDGFWPYMDEQIPILINRSEVNLEIRWESGRFIKSGAEMLDDTLVNDNLKWLRKQNLETILSPFEKGLSLFTQSEQNPELLTGVITDMYEALEATAKIITGKADKDLSANQELFLSKIKASEKYKKIMQDYIDYANDFRHAAKPGVSKPIIAPKEVESFIYLTGLFIRLAMDN